MCKIHLKNGFRDINFLVKMTILNKNERFNFQELKADLEDNNINCENELIYDCIEYLCSEGMLNKLGFEYETTRNNIWCSP